MYKKCTGKENQKMDFFRKIDQTGLKITVPQLQDVKNAINASTMQKNYVNLSVTIVTYIFTLTPGAWHKPDGQHLLTRHQLLIFFHPLSETQKTLLLIFQPDLVSIL